MKILCITRIGIFTRDWVAFVWCFCRRIRIAEEHIDADACRRRNTYVAAADTHTNVLAVLAGGAACGDNLSAQIVMLLAALLSVAAPMPAAFSLPVADRRRGW